MLPARGFAGRYREAVAPHASETRHLYPSQRKDFFPPAEDLTKAKAERYEANDRMHEVGHALSRFLCELPLVDDTPQYQAQHALGLLHG